MFFAHIATSIRKTKAYRLARKAAIVVRDIGDAVTFILVCAFSGDDELD